MYFCTDLMAFKREKEGGGAEEEDGISVKEDLNKLEFGIAVIELSKQFCCVFF